MQPLEHVCSYNNAAPIYKEYKRTNCNDEIVPGPTVEMGLQEKCHSNNEECLKQCGTHSLAVTYAFCLTEQ